MSEVSQRIEEQTRQSNTQASFLLGKLRILSSSVHRASESQFPPALDQLRDIHSAAVEASEAWKIVQILDHLHFPTMKERFANISGPAQGTFDWIFEDSEAFVEKQPGSEMSFRDWLGAGSGIFHVEGKPGSGKSTLMKHVCELTATKELLTEWAAQSKLITFHFFFWKRGTPEQRSLMGLIRGLLWGVVRQSPQLARLLFPHLWLPTEASDTSQPEIVELSEDDIVKAFILLTDGGIVFDEYRFCFFIDGLDEFEDSRGYTQSQLMQHLQRWTSNPSRNVKLCVSSRQLPIFSNTLSSAQRLTIHLFTSDDVRELVESRLWANTAFLELAKAEEDRCCNIAQQVIQRAEGVFLWVCVLLNQLEESLANGDSVTMLENIVDSAATELDDLFRSILDSIPLRYRKQAFTIFALALRLENFLLSEKSRDARGGAKKADYENGEWYLSLFSCSFLVEALDKNQNLERIVSTVPKSIPSDQAGYRSQVEIGNAAVAARCKGLLERRQGMVKFIHRSIPEFLQKFLVEKLTLSELNDEIISSTLAWMMLVDFSYREKTPKPDTNQHSGSMSTTFDTDLDSWSSTSNSILSESDDFAPTIPGRNKETDGCLGFIFRLLLQIQQAPGANSETVMMLLQQIERELLYHQFGVSTFDQVPQDKRHHIDTFSPDDDSLLIKSLYFLASRMAYTELIIWDHGSKTASLTQGQGWLVSNLLQGAFASLPSHRCTPRERKYMGFSISQMAEYFLKAGVVSMTTKMEVDDRFPPWSDYPDPDVWAKYAQVSSDSSSESSRFQEPIMVTLEDLIVISLLSKPRHSRREKAQLCLDPLPPGIMDLLRVFLAHGGGLSMSVSMARMHPNSTEVGAAGQLQADSDAEIELIQKDPYDKKGHDEDEDESGEDGNTYFMTGRSKHQLGERIHLLRDDGSEIMTFVGTIGSSHELVRSFRELLVSSGGSISLKELLRFITPPSQELPYPVVDLQISTQPDGDSEATHRSIEPEASSEKASVASADEEDSGSEIADPPGAVSWAALGEYLSLPVFLDAAVLTHCSCGAGSTCSVFFDGNVMKQESWRNLLRVIKHSSFHFISSSGSQVLPRKAHMREQLRIHKGKSPTFALVF